MLNNSKSSLKIKIFEPLKFHFVDPFIKKSDIQHKLLYLINFIGNLIY